MSASGKWRRWRKRCPPRAAAAVRGGPPEPSSVGEQSVRRSNSMRTQSLLQGNRFVHLVVLPKRFLRHLKRLLLVSYGLQRQRMYNEIHWTAVFLVRVRRPGQAGGTV